MRFLPLFLLLVVCWGATQPAQAQTIQYVTTPCVGCTTQAQLDAAATSFITKYLGLTPPGYVGVMSPAGAAAPHICNIGPAYASIVVVSSTTVQSLTTSYFGCYTFAPHAPPRIAAAYVASYTDPCWFANLTKTGCITGLTGNVNFKGTPTPGAPLPAVHPLAWGTTIAQIQQNFASNILYDVQVSPNLDAVMTNAPDIMLGRLSTELATLDTAGYTHLILAYAAEKVSATNLRRLQAVFGPSQIAAVLGYAPLAVQAAYNALPARAAYPISQYWVSQGHPLPSFARTAVQYPYDLFLVQYFSTNDAPLVALHKAQVYARVRIKGFWDVLGKGVIIMEILDRIYPSWSEDLQNAISTWAADYKGYWDPNPNIITIPDPTIEWPQPVDPGLPDFPPIDVPEPDLCWGDYAGSC